MWLFAFYRKMCRKHQKFQCSLNPFGIHFSISAFARNVFGQCKSFYKNATAIAAWFDCNNDKSISGRYNGMYSWDCEYWYHHMILDIPSPLHLFVDMIRTYICTHICGLIPYSIYYVIDPLHLLKENMKMPLWSKTNRHLNKQWNKLLYQSEVSSSLRITCFTNQGNLASYQWQGHH